MKWPYSDQNDRFVDNLVDNPVDKYVNYEVGNLLKTRDLQSWCVKLLSLH